MQYVRTLITIYHDAHSEAVHDFMKRALSVVRLLHEEALHRCLVHAKDAMRKRALCALMLQMHFHEPTQNSDGLNE